MNRLTRYLLIILALSTANLWAQQILPSNTEVTGYLTASKQLLTPGNIGSGGTVNATTSFTIGADLLIQRASANHMHTPDSLIIGTDPGITFTGIGTFLANSGGITEQYLGEDVKNRGGWWWNNLTNILGLWYEDNDVGSTVMGVTASNVYIGSSTTPQVDGLTVEDNIHAGGAVTSGSRRELKNVLEENPKAPDMSLMKTIRFNWKPRDGIDSTTPRYGIDIDDPSVPAEIKAKDLQGRNVLDHAASIGLLLAKVAEIEKRTKILEAQ